MTSLQQWGGVLALVAIVLAIGAYMYPKAQGTGTFGSASNCTDGYTCFTNLETQGNQVVDGVTTLTGTTTSGNIVLTTTNTATSSEQVGCIQTTATSTATPIRQMFVASTTIGGSVISAGFGGGTAQGFVLWGFGKCPGV